MHLKIHYFFEFSLPFTLHMLLFIAHKHNLRESGHCRCTRYWTEQLQNLLCSTLLARFHNKILSVIDSTLMHINVSCQCMKQWVWFPNIEIQVLYLKWWLNSFESWKLIHCKAPEKHFFFASKCRQESCRDSWYGTDSQPAVACRWKLNSSGY